MEEPTSPVERAADEALRILREPPPLAIVAVAAGLVELALARVAWQGLPDLVDLETLRAVRDLARFPRNLAAVSGTVAVVTAIFSFLRLPSFASIGRRLAVAAFAGVFVPGLVVATALPFASLRRTLVIFGLAAANVIVTLLALTAARSRPPLAARLAAGLAGTTAFLSLLLTGLGQLAYPEGTSEALLWVGSVLTAHPTVTQHVLLGLRHVGEVCWMGVLAGGATAILGRRGEGRRRRALAGGALTLLGGALFLAAAPLLGHRFRLMVFGAFRFGLLLDLAPWAYALPVGLALGAGLVGLAQREAEIRQLAGGVLLWLAAGYAPHTPIQLLYLVLSAVLITRSAQALDPEGAWRRRNPWLSLRVRGPAPAKEGGDERPPDAG